MNTAELDAFFARADDVLTDWRPTGDAMVARVPVDESSDLAPPGDSYYAQQAWQSPPVAFRLAIDVQPWIRAMDNVVASMARLTEDTARAGDAFAQMRRQLQRRSPRPSSPIMGAVASESLPARALWLRQNRNTGPQSRLGLDGHYRRRGTA